MKKKTNKILQASSRNEFVEILNYSNTCDTSLNGQALKKYIKSNNHGSLKVSGLSKP